MSKRGGYSTVPEDDPRWVAFWAAYPKRVSRKDAMKAFAELDPSTELVAKMVDALAWQSQQPQWTKDGGSFIPYPASWLRAERWDDEMPESMKPRARRCKYGHDPACDTDQQCTVRMLDEQRRQRQLRAV